MTNLLPIPEIITEKPKSLYSEMFGPCYQSRTMPSGLQILTEKIEKKYEQVVYLLACKSNTPKKIHIPTYTQFGRLVFTSIEKGQAHIDKYLEGDIHSFYLVELFVI